jgi:peptidyl-prolyl cis-trans isomerase C
MMSALRLVPGALVLAALGLGTLAGCAQESGPASEDIIATVNGKPVARNTFEQYAQGVSEKPASELTDEQRASLLDNLVRAAVVADEAERSGLAARPEVAGTLEIQRLRILERASAQEHLKGRTPSEAELKAEYDLRVTNMDRMQYRLSHIQVATAEEAQQVIEQLGKGASFAALARERSLDQGSRAQGGDLLWAGPSGMPPSFATAVASLKKGEVTPTPLRTDVGWHVVRMMDSREAQAPPFDSVREQLVEAVREKQFKAFTDSLVEKASITKTP